MPKLQLLITMNSDGTFEVGGPIQNKALCFAMLAGAKQVLIEYDPNAAAIVRAVGAFPNLNGG